LETWTETRGAVAPVNRALITIQLTVVKAELQEILETFRAINPGYRLETLHKLQKLIPTAQTLVEETGDKELREIVASIETPTRYLISTSRSGLRRNGCRTTFCDFPDVASSGGPVPRWVYDLEYPT
jgi:hypothetical protein